MRDRVSAPFVVAFVGVALACSTETTDATDAAEEPTTDAEGGVTAIDLPASQGTWSVAEDVGFQGTGAGDFDSVSITHGVGTIGFRGETMPAFFFTSTSTPTGTSNDGGAFSNDRDFEIVAAAPDRFVLAWITCSNTTDLTFVFYESTDGFDSATELTAHGTCSDAVTNVDESIALPAVNIPPPSVVPGFTIDGGSTLSFDGANAGSAELANATWSMYPFNVIDCSNCATPGWYELHTLFWNAANQSAALGILYLEAAHPGSVTLAYAIALPSFTTPYAGNQLAYTASWTTP